MEMRLTSEELFFLTRFLGAEGILGVSCPELDTPKKIAKREKKVAKELYNKNFVLSSKKGYMVSESIKPIVNACIISDLSWIIVLPDQKRIFYHITPDAVAEISGQGKDVLVNDFVDIQELFTRLRTFFILPSAPDPNFELALDIAAMTEIQMLITSNRAPEAIEKLCSAGLLRPQAEMYVNAYLMPIRKMSIAAINNRQKVSRAIDVLVSQNCNLMHEQAEGGLVKVHSFDFDKLIKKMTFAI